MGARLTGMMSVALLGLGFLLWPVQGSHSEETHPVPVMDDPIVEGAGIGQRAPDFALLDLDGNTMQLSDLRGHLVLVNFWASYCPFCRHEMPLFEAIHQERQDLVVLGINIGEDTSSIRSFVSEVGASYPILLDKTGGVTTAFGVLTLPATFLLDERGVVVWKKFGTTSEEELNQRLLQLERK